MKKCNLIGVRAFITLTFIFIVLCGTMNSWSLKIITTSKMIAVIIISIIIYFIIEIAILAIQIAINNKKKS